MTQLARGGLPVIRRHDSWVCHPSTPVIDFLSYFFLISYFFLPPFLLFLLIFFFFLPPLSFFLYKKSPVDFQTCVVITDTHNSCWDQLC